ncbi:MAG: MBL fold metallo-hydrolase [Sphingobacteriales bacterium]|nr:MBL fold metallo-hydrolase [Sphingobacteriales bacterium]MBI3717065.1 MBL fold metallo-hydrolase [Sphingobacteriales bacterium]
MKVEQIYTGCLAHGAYYIQSENEAAIIDPLREIKPYLQRAERNGAQIKFVFETHFHADFVSGHLDLAKATGATIVYGPTAQPRFLAHVAEDNEEFKVGKVTFKILHTPGHTMESACYLLKDENGKMAAIFSGDTLFIGDVGRPDLAQRGEITQEVLAGYLFDSLRNKVMNLPDDIIVYPGHGAGSACGKKISNETADTLGHQKQFNYALRSNMTRDEFIKEVLTGLTAPPQYFPENVRLNKLGYESFTEVLNRGLQPLNAKAFEAAAEETEALLLDTRNPHEFVKGYIPNAINIGLGGSFAPWVGALIPDLKQTILLIAEPGKEEEAITRLSRVGYDNCIGYLDGGFENWQQEGLPFDSIQSISPDELAELQRKDPSIKILDVRKESEYDSEHVVGVENFCLDYINDNMYKLDPDETYYIHCQSGYRSVIFISILKSRGFHKLINIKPGFKGLKASGLFPLTEYKEPVTML